MRQSEGSFQFRHNQRLLWDQREQYVKWPLNVMITLPVWIVAHE